MTVPTILLDQALAIAATGVPVFPCGANKAPVCVGGLNRATCNPASIRTLFSHKAAVLIGMPTGPASGVVVIDIDPRHDGNEWLDANRYRLPATRTHGTMSGGFHLVFNDSGHGIRNSAGLHKNGKGIAPGVDVRGAGGYVCIPPSPGYTITDDAPRAEVPAWLVALCNAPREPVPAEAMPLRKPRVAVAHGEASPYGRATLESACHDLSNAPEGAKHETINREAYSVGGLVSAGHIPQGEAIQALEGALRDLSARGTIKDMRAAERTLRAAFQQGMGRPRDIPDRPEAMAVDLSNVAPFLKQFEAANAALQRAATAAPLPVSNKLMDVDGALKMFVDYCQVTAISPQPFLALAAGITAIGALAGRRYRTKTNLRSNIYAVGVADSGGGKDHARKALKDIFLAAKLTRYMGGEDIASGTAIMTALMRHPAMLFQIDEFGDWLGDVLSPKASPHKKQIAQRLKTLYSAAGSFVSGTEYADQSARGREREDIIDPHACLLGTSTPGQFWRACAAGSLEDGLLARFLIFVSPESYPDQQLPEYNAPSPALVAAFQAIAHGPGPVVAGNLPEPHTAPMMPSESGEPHLVPMTPEAEVMFITMQRDQLERLRKHAGTYVTSITGRLLENATKLALVRAISRNPAAPVIGAADMGWGRALSEHCIDTLLREADQNVAETPYARNVQQAKKLIRKNGPITNSEMFRKGWTLPERDRLEILNNLTQSGQIIGTVKEPGKAGGRPTVRYTIGAD